MSQQPTLDVKPWMLPAIVLALTVPITVAFLTLGPFFGLLIGGAVGAAVVLTAVRLGSQAPRRRHREGARPDAARDPGSPRR